MNLDKKKQAHNVIIFTTFTQIILLNTNLQKGKKGRACARLQG